MHNTVRHTNTHTPSCVKGSPHERERYRALKRSSAHVVVVQASPSRSVPLAGAVAAAPRPECGPTIYSLLLGPDAVYPFSSL